ncbi:hypothetical protein [Carnobacterium viridans]|nr:hypothetical protein [Carnobacterium viridans]
MFNLLGYGWLTLGSLVFGLIAWFIPVFSIMRHKKEEIANQLPLY